eukprot:GEZU01019420.1.p1 GENE.GEZU01019420.1~~GEZU01019420.1.p1  ORF type:complete len:137 (-),score=2.18 GEZU01019420.1:972-1382(-)
MQVIRRVTATIVESRQRMSQPDTPKEEQVLGCGCHIDPGACQQDHGGKTVNKIMQDYLLPALRTYDRPTYEPGKELIMIIARSSSARSYRVDAHLANQPPCQTPPPRKPELLLACWLSSPTPCSTERLPSTPQLAC